RRWGSRTKRFDRAQTLPRLFRGLMTVASLDQPAGTESHQFGPDAHVIASVLAARAAMHRRIVIHCAQYRANTIAQNAQPAYSESALEGGFMSKTGAEGGLEALLTAAIVGDSAAVQAALAASPDLPRGSIHAAAALGDAEAALQLLGDAPSRAIE